LEGICEMLSGHHGRRITADDFLALGTRTLAVERGFNKAVGYTAAHDRLPDFFRTEKLPPHNITFAVSDEELDQVFAGIG
jgi:aldehyde:ferredoxin oxidoreductase